MLDDFVPVLRPRSEVEFAFAIAALESERILYLVHNGHFGGLYPGMRVALYNQRTILVPGESAAAAIQILDGIEGRGQLLSWRSPVFDRGRILCELFLFSWCIPGASARVKPMRALALALLAALLLSVALAVVLAASGLVGFWWEGLNRSRTPYGATSHSPFERSDRTRPDALRALTAARPTTALRICMLVTNHSSRPEPRPC